MRKSTPALFQGLSVKHKAVKSLEDNVHYFVPCRKGKISLLIQEKKYPKLTQLLTVLSK